MQNLYYGFVEVCIIEKLSWHQKTFYNVIAKHNRANLDELFLNQSEKSPESGFFDMLSVNDMLWTLLPAYGGVEGARAWSQVRILPTTCRLM